jgi:sulfotransferase family protein
MSSRGQVQPTPLWAKLDELEEYSALASGRLQHVVEVREPLVLVSQIQRSGGTLLSQLLDGHPECHADPFELKIGHPTKHDWPPLDLSQPEEWFSMLFDVSALERLRPTERTQRPQIGRSVFPCLFLPRLQRTIFDACVSERAIERERDVLDCYFTSYFNAWLDNHNLYVGPKKVVTAFAPRMSMSARNVERFRAAYPDGMLVSIVRDPRAWYASAYTHQPWYRRDFDRALDLWRQSTVAAVEERERDGERIVLLTYEQLVLETEATMRTVADRIGITMSPQLLMPTFNGMPIRANSSVDVSEFGVLRERVTAYRETLDRDTIARIERQCGELYERAAALPL